MSPRVLVVEDEARLRELLERVLPGWGFEVVAARSAEEAMRLAEADPPDIIILDLNLPGEGGLSFFRRVKQRWPNVQGIVQTGFGSVESAKVAIHLEVVEFLTKPASLGELEQALDRALRRVSTTLPVIPTSPADDVQDRQDTIDIPDDAPAGAAGKTLEEVERQHILATLIRHRGNRTATASALGISRRTLYYKIEEYEKQGFKVE
ncbi:response regulator transcription factor [Humisphaera borealis]|uniref:response regulator transcription factor n=1 Tax=Humisphaera borealis TaxID=2807512 RepID=UPI0019D14922|nr:response regulator [Humisphaera borealis]